MIVINLPSYLGLGLFSPRTHQLGNPSFEPASGSWTTTGWWFHFVGPGSSINQMIQVFIHLHFGWLRGIASSNIRLYLPKMDHITMNIYIYVCMYVYIYMYNYIYRCIYIYIYIYTYTHIYIDLWYGFFVLIGTVIGMAHSSGLVNLDTLHGSHSGAAAVFCPCFPCFVRRDQQWKWNIQRWDTLW